MAKTPTKLSSREVAALVGSLSGDDFGDDLASGARPYVFGANDPSHLGDYHALRIINERFCRIARSVFLPMLRIQPRLSSFPPEIRSFDEYRDSQDNFVSLTITRVEELRGNTLVVIPPTFVSLLTDAYYGGTIRHLKTTRPEFTATEQRVIEIVTDRINGALQLAWRDLMDLHFQVVSREENMQFAAFVDGEDMIVNCSFMVQLPGTEPASFDIIYPLQTLKPIQSQLRSRITSDQVDDNRSWRTLLENAVMSIPLSVTARLCETDVGLSRLMALKQGDIMPVQLQDNVELLVEGRPMFRTQPGNVAGRSSLSVQGRLTKE